ncbi:unnamed protein product [Mytilus edulis]|uniref:Uncharacterized protein n=1 Tax=Mytilus edulis TaxID=6550 RepID=A0A8S3UU60_MYTED|nr:unnamed protein product [Mytilus edulis]
MYDPELQFELEEFVTNLREEQHSCTEEGCSLFKTLICKQQAARRKLKTPTPSKNWLTSRKGNSRLTDSEKVEKIKQLKNYNSNLESQVAALKKKVEKSIRSEGVSLSENNSKDMVNLMTSCENTVNEQFPDENCFQRLFWSQQAKFNNLADKRGFIKFPSERLLYDYTHVIKQGVGFKAELIDMLAEEMESKGATEEWQQYVGLLQDENILPSEDYKSLKAPPVFRKENHFQLIAYTLRKIKLKY